MQYIESSNGIARSLKMRTTNLKQLAAITMLAIAVLSSNETIACGLIDEVAQLTQLNEGMKEHLNPNSEDTRFVVDRNNNGAFSQMNNEGLIHFQSDDNSNETKIGSATILNGCYALTSYHVVEGRDVIDGTKLPKAGRKVKFSFGAIPGRTDSFSNKSLDATVVDPGILNLDNRKWSDDMVLIKLSKKLPAASYSPIKLGHVFGQQLNTTPSSQLGKQFFVAAGYSADKISQTKKYELYGDYCNVKGAVADLGLSTDCLLTKGMSGGGLFKYTKSPTCNEYEKELVGLNIQASVGTGLFSKNSSGRSVIAPLTPSKISKINAIINQNLDENCN